MSEANTEVPPFPFKPGDHRRPDGTWVDKSNQPIEVDEKGHKT